MSYKKFFSAAALAMLLSISNTAFSDSVNTIEEDDDETNFYVSLHGSLGWGTIGDLKIKGSDNKSDDTSGNADKKSSLIKALKDNNLVEYKPNYKAPMGIGLSVGYRMANIRVELEGLYSRLCVDSKDESKYLYYDNASSYTMERGAVTNAQSALNSALQDTPPVEAKIKQEKQNLNTAVTNLANKIKANKIENKGFRTGALMANLYYDIDLSEDSPIGVYVGAGLGAAKVAFLDSNDEGFMDNMKFAAQGRVGANYAFNSTIKGYAGIRYFKVFNDEFKNITYSSGDNQPAAGDNSNQNTNTKHALNVQNSYGAVNVELGVMFNFNF